MSTQAHDVWVADTFEVDLSKYAASAPAGTAAKIALFGNKTEVMEFFRHVDQWRNDGVKTVSDNGAEVPIEKVFTDITARLHGGMDVFSKARAQLLASVDKIDDAEVRNAIVNNRLGAATADMQQTMAALDAKHFEDSYVHLIKSFTMLGLAHDDIAQHDAKVIATAQAWIDGLRGTINACETLSKLIAPFSAGGTGSVFVVSSFYAALNAYLDKQEGKKVSLAGITAGVFLDVVLNKAGDLMVSGLKHCVGSWIEGHIVPLLAQFTEKNTPFLRKFDEYLITHADKKFLDEYQALKVKNNNTLTHGELGSLTTPFDMQLKNYMATVGLIEHTTALIVGQILNQKEKLLMPAATQVFNSLLPHPDTMQGYVDSFVKQIGDPKTLITEHLRQFIVEEIEGYLNT